MHKITLYICIILFILVTKTPFLKQSNIIYVIFIVKIKKNMNKYLFFIFLYLIIDVHSGYTQKKYPCELEINKKAQKIYNKANDAYRKGEKLKANKYYNEAIEIQDDWAAPYYRLGLHIVYEIEKQPSKFEKSHQLVITYFEKVIQLCPQYNKDVYYHLGKIYYHAGIYNKAVINFESYLEDVDKIPIIKKEEIEKLAAYADLYEKLYNNPVAFDPQPVKNISSQYHEYMATITPDNDYFLFTRNKLDTIPQRFGEKDKYEYRETFTISERQKNGDFNYGEPLPEPFNQSKNEGGPTITVDNKYMVFTKCTNTLINIEQVYYNCDLYYSEYIDGYWTPITNLGKNINREDTWESQASISPDGQVLFFVSDRPGGIGVSEYDTIRTYDIYFSTRDANGNWRKAQNIGKPINTEENEKTPYIHSDMKTLYFSSTGHPGLGGYDIFYTRLGENGKWSKPVNIGYPINSENDDVGLFVNTMGNKAYFSTNRYSGNYDIYEFDLYKEAQPNKVLLVKGNLDFDKENAADIKMQLQNVDSKSLQNINVDKNTGKYAFIISNTQSDYVLSAKQEGAVYDLKYIAPKQLIEDGKLEINNIDMKLEAIEVGNSYKINDIYFATNSSELTEQSKNVIEILIDFMNDNSNITIEIQGHTDNIGQRKDNLILSNERAKEVYNYIIGRNIAPSRLKYKGYADTKPIATNDTEEGRSLNRRTVFVILTN